MTLQIKDIEKPLRIWSQVITLRNLILFKASFSHPFTVLNKTTSLWSKIISEKLPWVVVTEKALRGFKKEIDKIDGIEGLYINLREAYNRTPSGYIVDILVFVPDCKREKEYLIYDTFGELLRTGKPLLFDLHLIKLRGRKLEGVIPKGFWRYG